MKDEGYLISEYRREIELRQPASEEELIDAVKRMAESQRDKRRGRMNLLIISAVALFFLSLRQ